jgi:acyl-CoA thioester hydrolase
MTEKNRKSTVSLQESLLSQETCFSVPFFDVDSMNIVWHGHYCKYLELARCNLLDKIGYNYTAMKDSGFMFPIVDMQIKYIQPLVFEQSIKIMATLKEWESRLKISYEIMDAESLQILTRATTIQAAVKAGSTQLQFVCPDIFIQRVNQLLAQA